MKRISCKTDSSISRIFGGFGDFVTYPVGIHSAFHRLYCGGNHRYNTVRVEWTGTARSVNLKREDSVLDPKSHQSVLLRLPLGDFFEGNTY
jgi:hypothetical protein